MKNQAKNFGTLLNYNEELNVTLKYYNGAYYMFSEKTGTHCIKQESYNNHGFMSYDNVEPRAKAHWKGFIKNQSK